MNTLDIIGEFIALRDAAKEAANVASLNDIERVREVWEKVAYNFERLDMKIRPNTAFARATMASQRNGQ